MASSGGLSNLYLVKWKSAKHPSPSLLTLLRAKSPSDLRMRIPREFDYAGDHIEFQEYNGPLALHFDVESPLDKHPDFSIDMRPSSLAHDIALLFNDPTTSDYTFSVEGRRIYVHKAVISARCDTLKRQIFSGGSKTTAGKGTVVGDCSYSVFYQFLRYLYYDDVEPFEWDLPCILGDQTATGTGGEGGGGSEALEHYVCLHTLAGVYGLKRLRERVEQRMWDMIKVFIAKWCQIDLGSLGMGVSKGMASGLDKAARRTRKGTRAADGRADAAQMAVEIDEASSMPPPPPLFDDPPTAVEATAAPKTDPALAPSPAPAPAHSVGLVVNVGRGIALKRRRRHMVELIEALLGYCSFAKAFELKGLLLCCLALNESLWEWVSPSVKSEAAQVIGDSPGYLRLPDPIVRYVYPGHKGGSPWESIELKMVDTKPHLSGGTAAPCGTTSKDAAGGRGESSSMKEHFVKFLYPRFFRTLKKHRDLAIQAQQQDHRQRGRRVKSADDSRSDPSQSGGSGGSLGDCEVSDESSGTSPPSMPSDEPQQTQVQTAVAGGGDVSTNDTTQDGASSKGGTGSASASGVEGEGGGKRAAANRGTKRVMVWEALEQDLKRARHQDEAALAAAPQPPSQPQPPAPATASAAAAADQPPQPMDVDAPPSIQVTPPPPHGQDHFPVPPLPPALVQANDKKG
ncbi:unnamed protein product [Vitrella brassicaformis CCMP3155]|uniref:BTB domain-containing protein n=3 Tax=Vitrella brassicaformis TaxID=1169539 RepID=A0A0G4FZW7_VITBC|nr:unnamed protein product [Vitrella brassicaformis CCMP3155]|eukprot:CEM21177.1 unnamed protein product [Vitrella brassicaformis CCMP3155]